MDMQHFRKAETACKSQKNSIALLGLDSMALIAVGRRSAAQRAAKNFLLKQGIAVKAIAPAIILREV